MTSSFYAAQTDDDFAKAHNKALFNEIQHFMNPEEASLISFTDIKSLLKPIPATENGKEWQSLQYLK